MNGTRTKRNPGWGWLSLGISLAGLLLFWGSASGALISNALILGLFLGVLALVLGIIGRRTIPGIIGLILGGLAIAGNVFGLFMVALIRTI
jgi:hypothetical protein